MPLDSPAARSKTPYLAGSSSRRAVKTLERFRTWRARHFPGQRIASGPEDKDLVYLRPRAGMMADWPRGRRDPRPQGLPGFPIDSPREEEPER
jgi:hypothetical protein